MYPGVFEDGVKVDNQAMYVSNHAVAVAVTVAKDVVVAKMGMGQALGKITGSGKYGKYDNAAGDGREVMQGILAEGVDIDKTDQLTTMVVHGFLREAKCIGVDANGKNDVAGYIKFF